MATKIKIIRGLNYTDLEEKVNGFIATSKVHVVNVNITETSRKDVLACILYRNEESLSV